MITAPKRILACLYYTCFTLINYIFLGQLGDSETDMVLTVECAVLVDHVVEFILDCARGVAS